MPYDKNGKYYRKPVYKIEKIKKDLPLKKRRHFRFYILGLITPYVFIFCCVLILLLIAFATVALEKIFSFDLTQIPDAILFIITFLSLIALILKFYRIHKSQVRNYLKQGGKLTKKKIIILNTLWWITTPIFIAIPIYLVAMYYAFTTAMMGFEIIFGILEHLDKVLKG